MRITALRASRLFCYLLLVCLAIPSTAQRVLQVPGDASTVQAAINQASNGDTVRIAPGVYKEQINFGGKQITVQGSGLGAVLQGNGSGPVVTFANGETRASLLENVTVTGGATLAASSAGGVLVLNSSPTLQNVTVQANQGCGLGVFYGAPVIRNSHIIGTFSRIYDQGCLPLESHYPVVTGGVVLYGASSDGLQAQITGNIVENNQSQFVAGGIFINAAGQPLVENNIIRGNTSNGEGAGVTIFGDTAPILVQNLITGNTINPTLLAPALADVGAGVNIIPVSGQYDSTPIILVSNTIAGNVLLRVPGANAQGSQLYLDQEFGRVHLFNNLVIGASGQTSIQCVQEPTLPLQMPIFDHNDIYAGTTNPLSGACGNVLQTAGNILADPLFATGPSDPLPYTLELSSPAVDTGNNNAPYLPPTDLAGQPRIQNAHNLSSGIIDMGVYEYPGVPAQAPADFSVSLDPATLSLAQGTSASTTVILTPTSGTTASVTLACTGLPEGGTCSFSPAQLDLSDGMSHSSRLSVHLSPAASTSVDPLPQRRTPVTFAAGGVVLLLLLPRRRRKNIGSLLLLLTMCLGASGCGEIKVPFVSGPTAYHVTINAISNAGLTRQAGLTLEIVR